MELIDLYTREVGRNLPEKTRADIEKEIRSLIEDNLEDESQQTGRPVDEAMQVAVLKRLGPPEKMAASYLPPRYLIGPELYPHFVTTLRLVLAIVTLVTAVGIGFSLATGTNPSQDIIDIIVDVYAGFLGAIINAAGVVVLIFAIIQFTSPGFKAERKEEEWDPRKLLTEPDPQRVSIPGTIGNIVSTFLILVILNLYPRQMGIFALNPDGLVSAPILTDIFFRYLPWLSLVWILELATNLWLITSGKWSNLERWFMVLFSVMQILILAWMLSGPPIMAVQMEDLARLGWNLTPENARQLNDGLQLTVRLSIGIMLAFQVIDLSKKLYKLFRQRLPGVLIVDK